MPRSPGLGLPASPIYRRNICPPDRRSGWDEPLAALDHAGKALVTAMIAEHCAGGGIAIVATHEWLDLDCAQLRLGLA